MPAHAVGDRPKADVRPREKAILVDLAHIADMAGGRCLERRRGGLGRFQSLRSLRQGRGASATAAIERTGQHFREALRRRQAGLDQGRRRKAFAADRPPERLASEGLAMAETARRAQRESASRRQNRAPRPRRPASCSHAGERGLLRRLRRRHQFITAAATLFEVALRLQRVEQDRLGRLEPGLLGSSSGGGSASSPSAAENGQRKIAADAIDRGHSAPSTASPQKPAPSQKRQIGALR